MDTEGAAPCRSSLKSSTVQLLSMRQLLALAVDYPQVMRPITESLSARRAGGYMVVPGAHITAPRQGAEFSLVSAGMARRR